MNQSTKILATIGIVVVFIILFAVVVGATGSRGGGVAGILITAGAIWGISAIWKKKKD